MSDHNEPELDENGHCGSPTCDRNHRAEFQIASAIRQIVGQLSGMLDAKPADVIHGMAAALAHYGLDHSIDGHEQDAADDTVAILDGFNKALLTDPEFMQAKRARQAVAHAAMNTKH